MEMLLSQDQIQRRIYELAHELKRTLDVDRTTFVCVLKGARRFYSDLLANLQPRPFRSEMREAYYAVASYEGTESTQKIHCRLRPSEGEVANPNIVVVDDILDTGFTLQWLVNDLSEMNPAASIKTCVLLNKARSRNTDIAADYQGFTIQDQFVIGFGLDYDNRYRHLDDVMIMNDRDIAAHA